MRILTTLVLALLTLLIGGCSVLSGSGSNGSISHVVVVWLKSPGDEQARQSLIDAAQQLKGIPGVLDVHAGRVMPSTRPVVESTYDIALVVRFDSERSLRGYETHPIHLEVVEKYIKPLVDHYRVYDIRND